MRPRHSENIGGGKQVPVGSQTGSGADQHAQVEAFNKYSWSDRKKTVSIYTELDDLNDPVAERRRQSRNVQGNVQAQFGGSFSRIATRQFISNAIP